MYPTIGIDQIEKRKWHRAVHLFAVWWPLFIVRGRRNESRCLEESNGDEACFAIWDAICTSSLKSRLHFFDVCTYRKRKRLPPNCDHALKDFRQGMYLSSILSLRKIVIFSRVAVLHPKPLKHGGQVSTLDAIAIHLVTILFSYIVHHHASAALQRTVRPSDHLSCLDAVTQSRLVTFSHFQPSTRRLSIPFPYSLTRHGRGF